MMAQKPQTVSTAAHSSWAPITLLSSSGSLVPPLPTLGPRKQGSAEPANTSLETQQTPPASTQDTSPSQPHLSCNTPPSTAQPRCCLWEGGLRPESLRRWEDLETQFPQDGLHFLRNDIMSQEGVLSPGRNPCPQRAPHLQKDTLVLRGFCGPAQPLVLKWDPWMQEASRSSEVCQVPGRVPCP